MYLAISHKHTVARDRRVLLAARRHALLRALPCCPQGHPLSRLGIMAYLFVVHVLLVLCSFSGRHGPVP